jgi:hypothetical protein
MMGSTEHNMGRVAHNAFVFSWLIEQIERLNEVANSTPIRSYNAWMENWNSISTRSTYVLVQCSKLKSIPVDTSLVWKNDTKLEAWNEAMMQKQERIIASELYTGRTFVNQLQHLSRLTKVYVISAGAGLISMNQSIPAYDATFQSSHGPSVTEWHKLPYGGLSNLNLGENDCVVSFASPSYHRAIMADPHFVSMSSKFVVANTSPISKVEGVKSLPVHPRTAEYLKIASIDLNSALLKLFLEGGEGRFHEIFRECEALPSLKDKEKMTDEELLEVVRNLAPIRKIDDVIHHIRHVLGRKAAEKRIRDCVRQVRRSK